MKESIVKTKVLKISVDNFSKFIEESIIKVQKPWELEGIIFHPVRVFQNPPVVTGWLDNNGSVVIEAAGKKVKATFTVEEE